MKIRTGRSIFIPIVRFCLIAGLLLQVSFVRAVIADEGPIGRSILWDDPGKIRTLYPEDNSVVPLGSVEFIWRSDSLSSTYRIAIRDAEGIPIFDSLVRDTTIQIDQLFISGQWYSWRVRGSSDEGIEGVWSDTKTFRYPIIPVKMVLQSEPPDNSVDLPISQSLQWVSDQNADRYILHLSTDKFNTYRAYQNISDTSFVAEPWAYDVEYQWRVRAVNELGEGPWSEVWSFRTQVEPVGQIVLYSPENQERGLSRTPTLTWLPDTRADRYIVQLAYATSDFEAEPLREDTLYDTSIRVDTLAFDTQYVWRVRAENRAGAGPWSMPFTFRTQVRPVGRVVLIEPANYHDEVDPASVFRWSVDRQADVYLLQLSSDGFSSNVVSHLTQDTTHVVAALTYDREYIWRVRARNAAGDGSWSDSWRFTTKANPVNKVELVTPGDKVYGVSTTPEISWRADAHATSYIVEVSMNEFQTVLISKSVTDTFLTVPSLEYEEEYQWRVRAKNRSWLGPWSQARSFITQVRPVAQVQLVSPEDDFSGWPLQEALTWKSDRQATAYQIEISKDGFSVEERVLSTDTTYVAGNLAYATIYSWRVRASNSAGEGPWSATWQFTTQVAPVGQVSPRSPRHASMDIPVNHYLTWDRDANAKDYRVQISTQGFLEPDLDIFIEDTTVTVTNLAYDARYAWRVKALNATGEGPWSEVFEFTTQMRPVGLVEPVFPAHETNAGADGVTIGWSSDPYATTYTIHVSRNDFESYLGFEADADTTMTLTNLIPNTTYAWRVRAYNRSGEGPWSSTFRFNTVRKTGVETLPVAFTVSGVYPNPARQHASADLSVPQPQPVSVSLYDALGKRRWYEEVGRYAAGKHRVDLDLQGLPAGVYILSVRADLQLYNRLFQVVR